MSAEQARFYFVLFVLVVVGLAKILQIVYRRGRQSILRERFSCTLRPDQSVRQRL